MGLAQKSIANVNTDYFHEKKGGGCLSVLLPPILEPLLPRRSAAFSVNSLHPEVLHFVRVLAARRDARLSTTSPAGRMLEVGITNIQPEGDDFGAQLAIALDGRPAMHGQLTIATGLRRGLIAFAHAVMAAVETLLDHAYQMAQLERTELHLSIGLVEVRGAIDDPALVRDAIGANIRHPRRDGVPGFDPTLPYGLFPDEGFGYFYGDGFRLLESPLGG